MPTRPDFITESSREEERLDHYQNHSSCPPAPVPSRIITLPTAGSRLSSPRSRDITNSSRHALPSTSPQPESKADGPVRDTPSPVSSSSNEDAPDNESSPLPAILASSSSSPSALVSASPNTLSLDDYYASILHSPFTRSRFLPNTTSSLLRPGSRFDGTQKSDRQTYDVSVEIQHVDLEQSFLCGYLRIRGLTDEHPSLTTYFESEIIGTKYTFQTRHAEWGSNDKVDMAHWARFPEWKPLQKQAKREPGFCFRNWASRENIFMRWKEYFLVPDHRVRTISGASFEGFYYICFNQVRGSISGIYFHAKSEKYQQLELKHVDDGGCMSAFEFR